MSFIKNFAKTAILLAIVIVTIMVILTVGVIVLSSYGNVPPADPAPGNETDLGPVNVTITPTPEPTPTESPHGMRIVTGRDCSPLPGSSGTDAGQIDGKAARHIAYAFQPDVDGIADMAACWTVPEPPEFNGIQNHTIFLWSGIQQGNLGLVQAVLEWDHDDTGRYWTLACWIVNKRDQTYHTSSRLYVYPGDRIRAELRYEDDASNPGRKLWHILMTDETHGYTTELFDTWGAVDTNDDVMVFSGVLEGIGYVYDPIDLPGDVTFYNVTCMNENGKKMPMYLTGYVEPRFPDVAVEYEYGESGTPINIYTHYVNTTV